MKLVPIVIAIILTTTLFIGCTEPKPKNGNKPIDNTTYANFTNSQFYIEYPENWTIIDSNTTLASASTMVFLHIEDFVRVPLHK